MVEGANSKRGLANRATSCGCCGRGYRNQARHRSLKDRPSADAYDNRNRCSLSDTQPYSHRHAYAYAYAYANTHSYSYTSACAYAHADPPADANSHSYAPAHPYARLQRRTIPKLGVAILR